MSLPPINVNAKPSDSCNHWLCCFGCKCCSKKKETQSPPSVTFTRSSERSPTEERVVEVYHSHRSTPRPDNPIVHDIRFAEPRALRQVRQMSLVSPLDMEEIKSKGQESP